MAIIQQLRFWLWVEEVWRRREGFGNWRKWRKPSVIDACTDATYCKYRVGSCTIPFATPEILRVLSWIPITTRRVIAVISPLQRRRLPRIWSRPIQWGGPRTTVRGFYVFVFPVGFLLTGKQTAHETSGDPFLWLRVLPVLVSSQYKTEPKTQLDCWGLHTNHVQKRSEGNIPRRLGTFEENKAIKNGCSFFHKTVGRQ